MIMVKVVDTVKINVWEMFDLLKEKGLIKEGLNNGKVVNVELIDNDNLFGNKFIKFKLEKNIYHNEKLKIEKVEEELVKVDSNNSGRPIVGELHEGESVLTSSDTLKGVDYASNDFSAVTINFNISNETDVKDIAKQLSDVIRKNCSLI